MGFGKIMMGIFTKDLRIYSPPTSGKFIRQEAALKHGAKENEQPSLRPNYGKSYYAVYVIDLDGYQIEVVHN